MHIRLVLTTALLCFANAAGAGPIDLAAAHAAGLAKLAAVEPAKPVPEVAFVDKDGTETTLAAFKGKALLVNFWATWCAPCREEMPSLDRLNAELGGEDFAVLTIATGRNPVPAVQKFFADEGIKTLPILRDERQTLARAMGVLGLPVTVLIDAEGHEVARLIGDADWSSDAAKAVVTQLKAP